jgi:nucleoside-diphosphate-sugar epimerase
MDDVSSDGNIPWNELKDSTVLVTGATGLVGGVLVRVLSAANAGRSLGMRLIAHARDEARCGALAQECDVEPVGGDLREPSSLAGITDRIDYVIHCAAITKSSEMVARPVDVITTAAQGTKNILELARERHCRSFLYLSSMEIYGRTDLREVGESDLGYLDLSDPRSSYPESKRFCEMLCVAYAKQYGFPAKIARLAQTFGAGTPKDDTRVFAQFARSAMTREHMELHTEGKSRGNYCDTADAARGLLTILLKGGDGEAYNVANPAASATIREMAERVANEVCGGDVEVLVKVPEDIGRYGYAPDTGFTLKVDKLSALGWTPKYGLEEMYRRMLLDWQGR